MKEILKKEAGEATPEQVIQGLVQRQGNWIKDIRSALAPRLTREGLGVIAVRVGSELTEAMDQGSPMAHVHVDDPFQFLIKQLPTLFSWILLLRKRRKKSLVASPPEETHP